MKFTLMKFSTTLLVVIGLIAFANAGRPDNDCAAELDAERRRLESSVDEVCGNTGLEVTLQDRVEESGDHVRQIGDKAGKVKDSAKTCGKIKNDVKRKTGNVNQARKDNNRDCKKRRNQLKRKINKQRRKGNNKRVKQLRKQLAQHNRRCNKKKQEEDDVDNAIVVDKDVFTSEATTGLTSSVDVYKIQIDEITATIKAKEIELVNTTDETVRQQIKTEIDVQKKHVALITEVKQNVEASIQIIRNNEQTTEKTVTTVRVVTAAIDAIDAALEDVGITQPDDITEPSQTVRDSLTVIENTIAEVIASTRTSQQVETSIIVTEKERIQVTIDEAQQHITFYTQQQIENTQAGDAPKAIEAELQIKTWTAVHEEATKALQVIEEKTRVIEEKKPEFTTTVDSITSTTETAITAINDSITQINQSVTRITEILAQQPEDTDEIDEAVQDEIDEEQEKIDELRDIINTKYAEIQDAINQADVVFIDQTTSSVTVVDNTVEHDTRVVNVKHETIIEHEAEVSTRTDAILIQTETDSAVTQGRINFAEVEYEKVQDLLASQDKALIIEYHKENQRKVDVITAQIEAIEKTIQAVEVDTVRIVETHRKLVEKTVELKEKITNQEATNEALDSSDNEPLYNCRRKLDDLTEQVEQCRADQCGPNASKCAWANRT